MNALSQIRAAHRARWDEAADRQSAHGWHRLMDASCWLIAQGIADDEPCRGEVAYDMPLARVQIYLDGLPHPERQAAIERGRVFIFEGRHPVWVPEMEMAA